jgi:hypothetical protein
MKTHFTQADIGKTFATNQEGVTAKFLGFFESNKQYPCRWEYSNGGHWFTDYLGRAFKEEYNVLPDKEIISESDLLRKKIEELKEQLNSKCVYAVEYCELPESPTLISLHLTMEGAKKEGEQAKARMIENIDWCEDSEIIITEITLKP